MSQPDRPPIEPLPFSEPYVLATIRATEPTPTGMPTRPATLAAMPTQPIAANRMPIQPPWTRATQAQTPLQAQTPFQAQAPIRSAAQAQPMRGYAARHAAPPRAGTGPAPQATIPARPQIPHQPQSELRYPNRPPAYRPPARPGSGAIERAVPGRPPLFETAPEPALAKHRWILGAAALAIVLVAVCIGAVLVVGFGAKSVSDTIHNDEVAAGNDVAITGCEINRSTHRMVADVTITNRGRDAASYVVDVGFANADGTEQFDSGVATADGLPAGRTITVFATATSSAPAAFTCTVTGATRF